MSHKRGLRIKSKKNKEYKNYKIVNSSIHEKLEAIENLSTYDVKEMEELIDSLEKIKNEYYSNNVQIKKIERLRFLDFINIFIKKFAIKKK